MFSVDENLKTLNHARQMFFGGIPSSMSRIIPRWSNVHGVPVNVSLQSIMVVMSTLTLTFFSKQIFRRGMETIDNSYKGEWSATVENFDNVSL